MPPIASHTPLLAHHQEPSIPDVHGILLFLHTPREFGGDHPICHCEAHGTHESLMSAEPLNGTQPHLGSPVRCAQSSRNLHWFAQQCLATVLWWSTIAMIFTHDLRTSTSFICCPTTPEQLRLSTIARLFHCRAPCRAEWAASGPEPPSRLCPSLPPAPAVQRCSPMFGAHNAAWPASLQEFI